VVLLHFAVQRRPQAVSANREALRPSLDSTPCGPVPESPLERAVAHVVPRSVRRGRRGLPGSHSHPLR